MDFGHGLFTNSYLNKLSILTIVSNKVYSKPKKEFGLVSSLIDKYDKKNNESFLKVK